MDRFLTLPFANRQVRLAQGWVYSTSSMHRAIDYQRPGALTFPARAAAAGTVLFSGWDVWAGNIVVVSHDIGGTDTYRTLYMHLRNGAQADCASAWSLSVPSRSGESRNAYRARLNSSGCPQTASLRHPIPLYWGTADQTLPPDMVPGKVLQAGDFIGWAGETGPGGSGARAFD